MFKKSCPKCQHSSFSSCDTGTWICPYCHQDLTNARLLNPEPRKQGKPQLYLIHNRYKQHNPKSQPQVSLYIIKSDHENKLI